AGGDAHAFAGPRSEWGARLARAVHRAVRSALPAPG
ncbi:adenosylcobinamide amidohydrolase, partial [Streptomyces parvulus]